MLATARPRVLRGLPLDQAAGLVLAAEARAEYANPLFDYSAMDGFAVHAADVTGTGPWQLPVAGDIPAGAPVVDCPAGHAVRVMTGAPVPPGEDILVVPVEQTDIPAGPRELPEAVTVRSVDPSRSHVRPAGGKHPAGAAVAGPGTLIDAGTLAALVSAGVRSVDAYAAPRVAVISTGDELVAWPEAPGPSQLPDSNLPMIAGLAAENGAGEVLRLHSSDRGKSLAELFDEASGCDVIVTTGGISAGAFDVVRQVVEPRGGSWFGPVDQRPGTPQGMGRVGQASLVCLPGNPVAAYVSFHLYVAPLLAALRFGDAAGPTRPRIQAIAGTGFHPARKGKSLVVPVRLDYSGDQPTAVPFSTGAHNSSEVTALTGIGGITIIDGDAPEPGEPIAVELIRP